MTARARRSPATGRRRRADGSLLHPAALAWLALAAAAWTWKVLLPGLPPAGWLDGELAGAEFDPLTVARQAAAAAAALATLAVAALAAMGAGDAALAVLFRRPLQRGAGPRLRAVSLGLGFLGLAAVGLGFAGLLRRAPCAALLAGAGLAGMLALARFWPIARAPRGRLPTAVGWLRGCAALAAAGFLLRALAPEIEQDSLIYHLGKAEQYGLAGRIVPQPFSFLFDYPALWEALLTPLLLLGGEAAAKLLTPGVILLTAAALPAALGHRAPHRGWLAAALLLGTPLVARIASSTKNDAAVALFAFQAFLALNGTRGNGRAALAGIFLGFALAVKYTAFLPAAVLVGLAAWTRRGRNPVRALSAVAAGMAATGGPWLIRNTIEQGNPVFPLAAALFGGDLHAAGWAVDWAEFGGYVRGEYASIGGKLRSLYSLAVTEGTVLIPLLAVPAVVRGLRGGPGSAWSLAGGAMAGLWMLAPPQGRYLLAALPLLAGGLEMWTRALPGRTRLPALALLAGLAAAGTLQGFTGRACEAPARIACATGLVGPEAYRVRRLTTYKLVTDWLRARLPSDAGVIQFGEWRTSPASSRRLTGTFAVPAGFLSLAAEAPDARRLAVKLRQIGATHLLYNRLAASYMREKFSHALPGLPALARWAEMLRTRAAVAYEPPLIDIREGAYYVIDLDAAHPAGGDRLLPGSEGWLHLAQAARAAGREAECVDRLGRLRAAAGDFAVFDLEETLMEGATLNCEELTRRLTAVERRGLVSITQLTLLGRCARERGDHEEARRYLARAAALRWPSPRGPGI